MWGWGDETTGWVDRVIGWWIDCLVGLLAETWIGGVVVYIH